MPTIKVPYEPPTPPVTTTVAETITTTTIVCTVSSHNMSLSARKSQAIAIPEIGYSTPVGGKAKPVRVVIVAIPGTGALKIGSTTLANGAQVSLTSNGKMIYEAPSDFGGTTFTYKFVTDCGESATMTATIALAPDLPEPGGCA